MANAVLLAHQFTIFMADVVLVATPLDVKQEVAVVEMKFVLNPTLVQEGRARHQ